MCRRRSRVGPSRRSRRPSRRSAHSSSACADAARSCRPSPTPWKFRFRYEFARPDLELYHNHQINSYLSGRDNLFAKSSTGLRYEITDLFYLTLSLNVDYEKSPPPGTKKEDSTWVIGAGFEF
jgi:hypothetical protein